MHSRRRNLKRATELRRYNKSLLKCRIMAPIKDACEFILCEVKCFQPCNGKLGKDLGKLTGITRRMRRVLLIAYWFPPQPAAGALRPYYLARHLNTFGWEPTVLTPAVLGDTGVTCRLERVAVHRRLNAAASPSYSLRRRGPIEERVVRLAKSILQFPDDRLDWFLNAFAQGLRLIKAIRFDAIISSSPPPNVHFLARAFIARNRIPWIADYRDLWSGPADPYFLRYHGKARIAFSYACERWLLRRATTVTAATVAHANALSAYFQKSNVESIPNAMDLSAWDSIDAPPPRQFTLCYTGKLYPGLRTPDLLFSSVASMRAAGDPAGLAIRLKFYGEDPLMVEESARRFAVNDVVEVFGQVDRLTAMRAQRSAAVLILILNVEGALDRVETANPGSKVLEYAGARRYVLALGSENNTSKALVVSTNLGLFASNQSQCIGALRTLYSRFINGDVEPDFRPTSDIITPTQLAERFAATLDRAVTTADHRQEFNA